MFRKKRKKVVAGVPKKKHVLIRIVFCIAGIAIFMAACLFLYRFYISKNSYISPVAGINPLVNSGQSGSVEQYLQKNNIAYSSVTYTSNSAVVVLSTGTTVIFSLSKSLQSQTTTLQLIMTRLTIEGKKISKIDFTFDKPVITF